ncbi:SDR family oxidoreductase [Variovorax sp. J2P1-59]|uniref:SDR family oxidoreductase n=1 Tax=Variovorax flavidus TaxID=3053501 RepID=UPI0025751D14|nr:SDR family oxidoreductase [Variovorax sp. J2P1-59]MDM0078780.1 SDR family oxidoreductase [Variovorax sp. J2P1-59]
MSHPLFNLSGRTALVTGSSRGLGHGIAEALAQAGARIVLNGVDLERLAQSAESLRGKGHQVETAPFDVTDDVAVCAAFEQLDSRGIAVDILVNNAGIQLRKLLVDLSVDEWDKVLRTNLTSAFLVGREAARRMIARQSGGKVINIGSLTSEAARATVAPYTAAKGGIKMLTRAMAAEWAQHGIQANAIGPGYMATEMNTALLQNPEFDAWVKARTPARRWGRPDELGGTAIYLASAASDYVNGQILYVDGGMLAVL